MSLFPIVNILVQNTVAAAPTEKKKLLPQGAAPGGYTNTEVVDAQVALLCSDPSTYGVLAIQSNEVQLVIGKPSAGSTRGYTVEYMRAHEEARVLGAASNADNSIPKTHSDDYSVDYPSLKKARKALRAGDVVLSGGNLMVKGKIVTANPSAWGGSTTPTDEQLLGGVTNTVLDEMTGTFSPDAANIVVQDSLRKVVVHADQAVKIKESAIIKDNHIREVVDEQDPVLGVLDDVQAIVGGVKNFSPSLDQAALKKGQYKLAVNGSIDWKAGGVDKEAAETIFKAMPGCASLNFEKELIAELKGGVIGYAVLSVLKTASGKGGAIDLAVVRQKALEVEGNKVPGQPVIPHVEPAPVPPPPPAQEPVPTRAPAQEPQHAPVLQPAPVAQPIPEPQQIKIEKKEIPAVEAAAWKKEGAALDASGKKALIQSSAKSGKVDLIIGALFDPDPVVRTAACDVLANPSLSGSLKAVPWLVSIAFNDGADLGAGRSVRASALNTLYYMLKDSNKKELENILITVLVTMDINKPVDRSAMTMAVQKLGELSSADAVPSITAVLAYKPANAAKLADGDVRIIAVQALMKIYKAHPEAITDDAVAAVQALKTDPNKVLVGVVNEAIKLFGKKTAGIQAGQRPEPQKTEGTMTYENANLMLPEYQLEFASYSVENGAKLLSGIQAGRQRRIDEKALRGSAARGLITVLTRDFGYESGLVVTTVKGKKGDEVTFSAKGKVNPPQEIYLVSSMSLQEIETLTSYRNDLINGKVLQNGKKALPGTKEYREAIISEINRISKAGSSDSEAFLPA